VSLSSARAKILVAGSWLWPWYHEACARALESLGYTVERFGWRAVFYRDGLVQGQPRYRSRWAALQNRLLFGPALRRINAQLIERAAQFKPDLIWLYNCTHVFPRTVETLRRLIPSAVVAQYSNDNPFGTHARPDYFRHLKKSIPLCDIHFVYRHSNVQEFVHAGATRVHLLRSYYVPEEDHRVVLTAADEGYRSDVVFVGHYEPDFRLNAMNALAERGYRLNLFGAGWNDSVRPVDDSSLQSCFPVRPVLGEEYRKAVSGAKIALSFLSKRNADTYTRRNFQIPAMGAFMLSEYSDDLASLFEEGTDAEYFRSIPELLDKTEYYLKHDASRERIARRGYERVVRDGHDVTSRMKQFGDIVFEQ